ncbi:MAG: acyltransferase family protein [Bacteroidetes bacterium]|nr:acyltransferase family protein [Bacteroidota bacterium]MBI3483332.1 acyltransferase family protein [Bacteroidota bacterium]
MQTTDRRYFIDWIRVIAIGLLLLYHVAIGFQPWGIMIGFITNKTSWGSLWIPMMMLNVWRIPLLFFVSGMGVYFAIQNRNWKQLIVERTWRIWFPFVFGIFCIVPIHVYIVQSYYHMGLSYTPNQGHLWFLGNIFSYVIILSPLIFYFKRNEEGKIVSIIKKIFSNPLGLLLVMSAFVAEALIIKPYPYELYAMTWHGYFLGLLGFFFGFCFVMCGNSFWNMIVKWKWLFLSAAVVFFILRLVQFKMNAPIYLLVAESDCWIISVFAFGFKYLNRGGRALTYLSQAAYPVYILHMIFLFLGSMLIFPLEIDVRIQFVLVLLFTFAGCFAVYELIRRVNILRPLFGLKMKPKEEYKLMPEQS